MLDAAATARAELATQYDDHDRTVLAISRRGRRLHQYHPRGLPAATPTIAAIASAEAGLAKAQAALSAVAHHRAWREVYHERLAEGHAAASAFISVSQPGAGAWLKAVPASPDLPTLAICTLRRYYVSRSTYISISVTNVSPCTGITQSEWVITHPRVLLACYLVTSLEFFSEHIPVKH